MSTAVAHAAHEISSRAITWLHANRHLGGFPSETTADLGDPDSVYKPLSETVLLSSLVLREGVAGPGEAQHARELLDFAWQQVREGDLLYERQLRHSVLTDPLETYAHFARSGKRHEGLEELLAHSAALGALTEVMPNRRLAVANARRIVGIGDGEDWAELTRVTWLGATPQPWAIDWMTGYCLTHTVFHLTDWGARPEDMPEDLADYVATWLPVWIDIWSEVEQWDLVAELLIVGVCLPEPLFQEADWKRLAGVQHADGLVPRDGAPVDDDPLQRFSDQQHPTIVAAIAGTLALSRLLST
ncbi:hypothetical protein ALI22I_20970 [Saccharothrix sp. ALI-22-I]|uniref:DUF6895 family protein n=1 Tax=Saccharothrix sp. ALI-22-I TaxID=1933778 RepID=UPI00097BE56E|nr:hypothetical protein [Saccharothrix sp. ALI-22-I]ONI87683.1 hypothetical protein ALI22I_20970 [Saccharothrix sp. ALI-22-I]